MQVTEEDYQLFKQAILRGDAESADYLIIKGIDVNRPMEFQMTNGEVLLFPAIFAAVDHNHLKATNLLIKNGAKLDVFRRQKGKDNSVIYITPLWRALDLWKGSKSDEMVNLLIKNGADLSFTKKTSYKTGIVCKTPALLDVIEQIEIKGEVSYSSKEHPPANLLLQGLMDSLVGPSQQKTDYSFLYVMIEQLSNNRADVNQIIEVGDYKIPILYFAIIRQDQGLVKTLLSLGASWEVEIQLRDIKKCLLKKFPFNRTSAHDPFYLPEKYHEYRLSDSFLRFLKENGWKGEGIFGWRG